MVDTDISLVRTGSVIKSYSGLPIRMQETETVMDFEKMLFDHSFDPILEYLDGTNTLDNIS